MRDDIVFEITENHLESGLRGVPIGYCSTSYIDPTKGLYYATKTLFEVSLWEEERVIYLLEHGMDPTDEELDQFKQKLKKFGALSQETVDLIRQLPKKLDPIHLFSSAILIASYENNQEDEAAISLIAKLPALAATVINHHASSEKTNSFDPECGYIENFVNMLSPKEKVSEKFLPLMKLFAILHFDHGGGSLETFVGKAVSSAESNIFSSVATAMQALGGKLNGHASKISLEWLKSLGQKEVDPKELEEKLVNALKSKQKIFGFGHPTFRIEDSRATLLYNFARKHFAAHPLVQRALTMRYCAPKVLSENSKIKNPNPNSDAISGAAFAASGFDHPEYFSLLLAMARAVGVTIQILGENSKHKKDPIFHPHYFYRAKKWGK